jgi:hypothetical protein
MGRPPKPEPLCHAGELRELFLGEPDDGSVGVSIDLGQLVEAA